MKTFVSSKIHGVRVTDKSIIYHGSVSIGRDLMTGAGIAEFEQVHVVNLTNGNRWVTYAIATDDGQFTLNGGGARLGEVGDVCVIMTYDTTDDYTGADIIFCNERNEITGRGRYA